MNLKTASLKLDMDYMTTVNRFGGNEGLCCRFLKKLSGDPSEQRLREAVEKKDYAEIEIQAHTLKGMSANLGLEAVRKASDALVQAVRSEKYDMVDELFACFETTYNHAIQIISQID